MRIEFAHTHLHTTRAVYVMDAHHRLRRIQLNNKLVLANYNRMLRYDVKQYSYAVSEFVI